MLVFTIKPTTYNGDLDLDFCLLLERLSMLLGDSLATWKVQNKNLKIMWMLLFQQFQQLSYFSLTLSTWW